MPAKKFAEPWVAGFRQAIRSSTAQGWGVREWGSRVRLEVRRDGGRVCRVPLHAQVQRLDALQEEEGTALAGYSHLSPHDWAPIPDGACHTRLRHGEG
jgi:hypothetical protein